MREILFKAKRKDNGKWVEGYYYKIWEDHYILWGMTNDKPDMIKVIPETLCQYTGATDENGNKIWENDVIAEIERGYIKWDSHLSAFLIVYDEYQTYLYCGGWLRVIGNIFDNPELIER